MGIILNDVSYTYNNGLIKEKQALKDINLNFNDGKIYGIAGKSGSGKSTLVELINESIKPTKGVITKTISKTDICIVNQFTDEQFLMNTVKEELEYSLIDRNIKINNQILKALDMVGLNIYYLSQNPRQLSSGEKRLISIASALVCSPRVLILDEPALGLDRINKKNLVRTLKRINNKYDVTIIIVSHDIDFLNLLIDEIIILEDGKLLSSGKKEDIFKKTAFLKRHGIEIPKILEFSNKVQKEKNIKLGIYDDVKDLIKAVYRNV